MQKYSGAGRPIPSPREASILLKKFREAQEKQWKIYYEPLYDYTNLPGPGISDPVTGAIQGPISFFNQRVGEPGGGFARRKTLAETNLTTSNGQFDANQEYVAYSFAVDVHENNPLLLKAALVQDGFVVQQRGSANIWQAGALRFYPLGDIGLISASVSITAPDALIEFARNGSRGAICFPPGGEIYFPPLQQISFTVDFSEQLFATANNQPINAQETNVITTAYLGIVMYGFKFERVTP